MNTGVRTVTPALALILGDSTVPVTSEQPSVTAPAGEGTSALSGQSRRA